VISSWGSPRICQLPKMSLARLIFGEIAETARPSEVEPVDLIITDVDI
jgi:hypothetical protein